ncbi:MAG: TIGR02584 family CRISPR-associated protein [Burkholderiales bacterium]|nr:TIGR02584 family CRISPR-associated protein [Burkholderiales bacterium]
MSVPAPESFARRILLCVTGLSPQVVTETIYALSLCARPAFVPTEIHLITTGEGADQARHTLLSKKPGWFHRLRTDFDLAAIRFTETQIHVLSDSTGRLLADIRSPEENARAADFITEKVRGLTSDPDCALHVSIAGGRKTMGFYLGYALSLFGRPQDRLSHVLVSSPFESSPHFFYPSPESRVITLHDGRHVDCIDARVTLAEIPFVSLRHGLPRALLEGRASYVATVEAARDALGPAQLTIDVNARRIRAAGRSIELAPAQLALLTLFARRARAGLPALGAPPKGVPEPAWAESYLRELRVIRGPASDLDATERTLRQGMDGEYFSQLLSKLRRAMQRELGTAALPYLVNDGGGRPRRYRLDLPPQAVRFSPIIERASPASRARSSRASRGP